MKPESFSSSSRPRPGAESLAIAQDACAALVRAYDPDRYVATVFAPAWARGPLFALYAFNLEIARVRESVSEVLPGEIRHQWWRDTLSCGLKGDAAGHPVAVAICDALRTYNLPPDPLLALIEARSFDLYDDPMPTWLDLEGYCGETSSALVRLATIVLAKGEDPGCADLCGHAGVAYALAGLLRALPVHARRQQCYLPHEALISAGVSLDALHSGTDSPGLRHVLAEMRKRARDHLSALRQGIARVPPAIAPAFLPVSLVEPYLTAMERRSYRPFEDRIDCLPLARFWHIGRNAWRSRCL